MRYVTGAAMAVVLALSAGSVAAADYPWQPDRPITVIVPGAAGGWTDQVTRVVAGELAEALGQKVLIVNQPGASGSIGTRNAWEAPHDGYTWAAGAAADLGTYPVLGILDARLEDWALFLDVANVAVIGVNRDSPYEDVSQLLDAMKANPGEVSVATAGPSSAGHDAIEAVAQQAGVQYRHVAYDGASPAVIAAVAGETEVTTQLAVEQAEMIRAKRLRPLAVIGAEPLELAGYGTIPPVTEDLPDISLATDYFGIWTPKDVPAEVLETIAAVWQDKIAQSQKLKAHAAARGALFTPYWGDDAQERAMGMVRQNAWLLYDAGEAAVSPDEVGIERP